MMSAAPGGVAVEMNEISVSSSGSSLPSGRIGHSDRIGSPGGGLGLNIGGASKPGTSLTDEMLMETLNEPVSETILRDVRMVGLKLKHVLIPTNSITELRNWDLWGPLILCLLLATTLSITSKEDEAADVFAFVFLFLSLGASFVTINAALLGGTVSFLQSVCVLGYCLAPMNVASILCRIWLNKIYQGILVTLGFAWSTRASVGFMAQLVAPERRALGVYPVLLFYVTIALLILGHSSAP